MARDRISVVCRDCGEVSHFNLAGVKPGGLLSCAACGLVTDPAHLRLPAFDVTRRLQHGLAGPARGAGARIRR